MIMPSMMFMMIIIIILTIINMINTIMRDKASSTPNHHHTRVWMIIINTIIMTDPQPPMGVPDPTRQCGTPHLFIHCR